ncbi:hypothetical protein SB767_32970, partial [Bacillus sp. SIMBA_069]
TAGGAAGGVAAAGRNGRPGSSFATNGRRHFGQNDGVSPSPTSTVFERQQPDEAVVRRALAPTRQAVFWTEDAPGDPYPRLTGDHS